MQDRTVPRPPRNDGRIGCDGGKLASRGFLFGLAEAVGLAGSALLHALALEVVFGQQRRDADWLALVVQRHVDQVGGVGVPAFPGPGVFGDHGDLGFHRGGAHVADLGGEGDQIADADGMLEGEPVHGDGDHALVRVAHGGQRTGLVDQLHDVAAVHVAGHVGVDGVHELRNDRPRGGDGVRRKRGFTH